MKLTRIAIAVFVILLLISLVNRSSTSIRIRAVETAQPAFRVTNQIFRKINSFLKPKDTKLTETQKLRAKVKILEARLAQMEELSLENERLKTLLDFRKKIAYQTIPAQVIGRDPSNWTNIIYIDKGKNQGLAPNMGVTTDQGVVGRIIEVGASVSKVMLINDPDSRIAATVQRSREEGLLCGTLSRRCRMTYISRDADVKIGDLVATSGSTETFPRRLLIGKIADVFEGKGGLYRSAIIKPAADLQRLEEVLCIK